MNRIQIKKIWELCFYILFLLLPFGKISAQNNNANNNFMINGTVPGAVNGIVKLNYFVGKKWREDSAGIRDGKFKFAGAVASPVAASLYFKKKRNHRLNFFLEGSTINIELNVDSIEISKVSGSRSNIDFDSVKALLVPYYASLSALKTLSEYARDNHLSIVEKNIDALYDLLPISQRKIITAYALAHPDSYAITGRVSINFTNNQTELSLLKEIYNNFSSNVKDADGGKSIAGLIKRMERVQIGNEAPDFTLTDEKGKQVKFSSFKGKYYWISGPVGVCHAGQKAPHW